MFYSIELFHYAACKFDKKPHNNFNFYNNDSHENTVYSTCNLAIEIPRLLTNQIYIWFNSIIINVLYPNYTTFLLMLKFWKIRLYF